ncbi:MAG: translation elongation factor Ts [Clostridiales bacterium]|uniref:Elongation factor Ts n=1 Tax=Peptococcus niger TaxID=2741 RepID=A0A1G6YKQ8_PEPNI|nr:translation elongation factor Ts [Peptococcus niger]MBS5594729.1 translation elongation factor Ts [Clostridiales bacterium]MDU7506140.1 translation elongation factor Ts [Clostridia bacterium]MDU2292780.1 translation elongation factor Ts [Peptococcus niger]MDU5951311.1 translation elongation factor Ts [Clostridiales bacterium]SDD90871.1 translation elongation factor Ts (EF-Ts) [Peptococcus niger]
MANITASMVKELREQTGSGMMDCKKALQETDGDMDKAVDLLREKGMADSAKKAGRIAAEGVIASYLHMGGRIGVMVEINCETDFVAKTDAFKEFAQNIAMHIAAANPSYLTAEEVPEEELNHEREVLKAQALNENKPEHIVEKMVEGRLKKYYAENCLMQQAYIRSETDETIEDIVKSAIAEFGENIKIRRFTRYEMGEGLEKRSEDFAAEVAAQVNQG